MLPAVMQSEADACTSAIVSARASATGRPLLWKHRDTGADNNFLARVEATDSTLAYVGLFNAGDSLLTEAWMGMNERGLGVMNTASYNLAPDTATYCDREGAVMVMALAGCVTVDDFEALLARLPRPMGVQANFGVIDAEGGAAYFETNDVGYTRFDVDESADGWLVRTNFSLSGEPGRGYGYIRYNTARKLVAEADSITPALFTEGLSRSFYHSLTGINYLADTTCHVVHDGDFIPRNISTSSVVVEGGDPSGMTMWAILGYPPCGDTYRVTLDNIPTPLQPDAVWRSPACDEAMSRRRALAPYKGGSGRDYLDLDRLRIEIDRHRAAAAGLYSR